VTHIKVYSIISCYEIINHVYIISKLLFTSINTVSCLLIPVYKYFGHISKIKNRMAEISQILTKNGIKARIYQSTRYAVSGSPEHFMQRLNQVN
jgi:hypothetical protein